MTNNYNTQESERVPRILNWPGQKGLRLMQTLNGEQQEKCRTNMGLFEVLRGQLQPQHNETIL